MVELFIDNILAVIRKMQKENIKSVAPRKDASEAFMEHADLWTKRTAWAGPCRSWFKGGRLDGTLTIFPGSRVVLADLVSTPRFEDYDYEYWGMNKFGFLGNGFATMEYDGSDIAWYLETKDGLLPVADADTSVPQSATKAVVNGD